MVTSDVATTNSSIHTSSQNRSPTSWSSWIPDEHPGDDPRRDVEEEAGAGELGGEGDEDADLDHHDRGEILHGEHGDRLEVEDGDDRRGDDGDPADEGRELEPAHLGLDLAAEDVEEHEREQRPEARPVDERPGDDAPDLALADLVAPQEQVSELRLVDGVDDERQHTGRDQKYRSW